tara:strand:- start:6333 stop:6602 length:270 start_codon:yes stop_codon:yes gene_type:complete
MKHKKNRIVPNNEISTIKVKNRELFTVDEEKKYEIEDEIGNEIEDEVNKQETCKHVWECLRGRTHNKGNGKGKYQAYKCRECGKFQRRY